MENFIFKESQKFRQKWIWVLMTLLTLVTIYLILTTGSSISADNFGKVFSMLLLGLMWWLLLAINMEVYMDQNELKYRYPPFINRWRRFPFDQIDQLEIIEYNSFWEFGGWGIRYNLNYWLYNTGGKYGIKVKSGKKNFILGTFKPDEARIVIDHFNQQKSF
ncbi:hypothetical protein [Pararhodonellum marinum]|uniref:hypothetical protein n=1 Tax=Pararhodonellum marinum TaxID=2755358 RepID=UPI00188DD6CE|nr:hypothetical protein [Pararhodonellum marinum]